MSVLIFLDSMAYNSVGLLFVVLGVLALIRMTGFPDLTVDGSFTLGAAVFTLLIATGGGIILALLATIATGMAAGLLTWVINVKLKVGKVISGVLSMVILVLVAPYITGGSSQSLLRVDSLMTDLDNADAWLTAAFAPELPYRFHLAFTGFWLVCFTATAIVCYTFLRSRIGVELRYHGSAINPVLVDKKRRGALVALGLAAGNALVAVGGAIEAQRRGGFTVNMGTGIILVSLAAMILGESLWKSVRRRDFLHLGEHIGGAILGTLVYAAGVQLILLLQIDIIDLRLLTALFLVLLLGYAGRFHSSSAKLF